VTEDFTDLGLPLAQLKEQRRELIFAVMSRPAGPVPNDRIVEISAVQQAIAAREATIIDRSAA
jgi:hypothetical protein